MEPSSASSFLLTEAELRAAGGAKWRRYGEHVLPAWVADMDFRAAAPVARAIHGLVERHGLGYPERDPDAGLEAAFARRMHGRFGWEPEPELCLPVADLIQATYALLLAFSEPGDGVVLHTPIYPPFLGAVTTTGRRVVANPLLDMGDRFELDAGGLAGAAGCSRLVVLCNPHNPTGRVLSRADLEVVASLAAEHDLVVIADEIHCDLVYPGSRHIPFASLSSDAAGRTVTINSATKGFNIAGLRCGVMQFGSGQLLERFRKQIPDRLLGQVSRAGLEATVAAWDHGQEWLDRVLAQLTANRDRVGAWIRERAPAIVHHPPEATYLAWLDCRALDLERPTAHEHFLRLAGVGLSAGEEFGPGGDGRVRLNFATSPGILESLLERMAPAVRSRISD